MKFLARSILVFSLFLIFHFSSLIFLPSSVHAQTTNQYNTPNTNPDVPKNLHTWTQNVLIEVMAAAICQLAGVDPLHPQGQCLGFDTTTGKIGYMPPPNPQQPGGAIGFMTNLITMTYTIPVHTNDYTQYLAQNFGITKPAYAQTTGAGFDGLKPLLGIWTVFRNLAYLFYVAIFIIIGFAIMLRIKIDPRTVMSIGNQLPNIVVSILLVTFSYAIAGFLVDMMYVSIYVTTNVISSADPTLKNGKLSSQLVQSTNPFGAADAVAGAGGETGGWGRFAQQPAEAVGDFIAPLFDNPVGRIVTGVLTGFIINTVAQKSGIDTWLKGIGGFIGTVAGPIGVTVGVAIGSLIASLAAGVLAPNVGGAIIGIIAFLIIAIALLWALFRLWIELIKSYVFILLDVAFAPFWMLLGIFPGSPVSFTLWLRDIVAHLAAFPLAIGMFLMGRVLINAFGNNATGFVPPLIGNPSNTGYIGNIIGMGIILMIPQVVNMTKDFLKAPSFKYTAAIGQAIGVGSGAPGGLTGQASHIGSTIFGLQNVPGLGGLPILNKFLGKAKPGHGG